MAAPVDELVATGAAAVAPGEPVPARPRSTTRPITLRLWDRELRCEKIRGVGFRFVCTCGDEGPGRSERAEAVADKLAHDRHHAEHGPRRELDPPSSEGPGAAS